MKYPKINFSCTWFDTHAPDPKALKHVEEDEIERIETEFSLCFRTNGAGYGFTCTADGTVNVDALTDCQRNSWNDATSREWEEIEVTPVYHRTRLCSCGSRKPSSRRYDGRGIYLCSTCPDCREEKMSRYRPAILAPYSQSDVDEPIEPEEY